MTDVSGIKYHVPRDCLSSEVESDKQSYTPLHSTLVLDYTFDNERSTPNHSQTIFQASPSTIGNQLEAQSFPLNNTPNTEIPTVDNIA
jgi:hypothetical protein